MARDFSINSDKQTEYNDAGDIRNATDTEFLANRIFISITETVDLSPPPYSDSAAIEEQRSNIESAVRRNQFTSRPISVSVVSTDPDDDAIAYSISTQQITELLTTD